MNKFIQHKMMECSMLGTSTILSASVLTRLAIHSALNGMNTGGEITNGEANRRLKMVRQLYDVFNRVKYPEIIAMCEELLKLRARNSILDARADRLRRGTLIGGISEPGIVAAGKFTDNINRMLNAPDMQCNEVDSPGPDHQPSLKLGALEDWTVEVTKPPYTPLYNPDTHRILTAVCRLAQWHNSSRDELGEILLPHSPESMDDTTNRLTVISGQFQEKVDRAIEVSALSKAIGETVVATVIRITDTLPIKHPAHKLVKLLKDPNHHLWTHRGIELTVGTDTVSFTRGRCTW